MIRRFNRGSVRRTLEAGYGVKIAELVPLAGHAHSFNFKAVAADGSVFAVKCFPEGKEDLFGRLIAHTAPSDNPLAATRLFGGKILGFEGWKVVALKWIEGTRRFPDELADEETEELLSAHGKFLAGLKDDGFVMPARDAVSIKRNLLARLEGANAPELVREIKEIRDASLTLAPEAVSIIHGDLHWENFRFLGGKVSGFLDLEELRFGTPAEDLIRYIVCRAEHLRWYEIAKTGRLLDVFRKFIAHTAFTRDEWLFAIDGYLLRKLDKKVKSNSVSRALRVNLSARFPFYRRLREIVDEELPAARKDGRTVVKMLGGTVKRFMGGKTFDWGEGFRFVCDPGCGDYDWLCVYDELPGSYPGVHGGKMRVAARARTMLLTQEPVSVKSYNSGYTRRFDVLLTNRPQEAERHPGYAKGEGYMVWYTGRSYREELAHAIPEKTKLLSAVYSAKSMTHTEHANRCRLLELLERDVPGFDRYGKGVRPLESKAEALDPYKYTIAFENHIGKGHWTEKLSDALVCGCLPFYAGDPSIGEMLPPDCFIPIPSRDPANALDIIRRAMADGEWEKRRGAIAEARRLLFEKYNLFAQIERAIAGAGGAGGAVARRFIETRRHARMNPLVAASDLWSHLRRLFTRNPGGAK
ncbi:MAG: aminoglycoside phosphotransferase family protein [Kiritimatiellae bacterium]|nr:aminoglycoside phosphotransferase family protein [Kiritimatiellia bacterium]